MQQKFNRRQIFLLKLLYVLIKLHILNDSRRSPTAQLTNNECFRRRMCLDKLAGLVMQFDVVACKKGIY